MMTDERTKDIGIDPNADRWPHEFQSWPRDQQMVTVKRRMTRVGLISEILELSGLPTDQISVSDDKKLTKKELAAVYLAIQEIDYESD